MLKIDLFPLTREAFDQQTMARRQRHPFSEEDREPAYFKSPEDIILTKLVWFEKGGRVSERQWQDVLGVLRVQGSALDAAHLHHWARTLGVASLLDQAIKETGG